jgi:pilus assembly protein Flp/PilA
MEGVDLFGMETDMQFFRKIVRDSAGATAIEYGLIAALISIASIAAIQGIGSQLNNTFSSTSSSIAA